MAENKFSARMFREVADNAPALRELLLHLRAEVLRRLHPVVEPAFREVVSELNATGHNLLPRDLNIGDITYHDIDEAMGGECRRLWLGVDIVVSTGYGDTLALGDDSEV
jgi:hypothetical protein